jgi:methionyl-tRNA formyltransferase
LRIAFFGSSSFSCLVLDKLLASSHNIACVVTQPDQPAGRSMALKPTQVALDASAAGIPVLKPARLRGDTDTLEQLRRLDLDALMVASFGQILPKRILDLTPWPLNVHPSDLPKLRGASPIRTALLQGLARTACCIMRMTPRLDDGDVLLREPVTIGPDWNNEQLEMRLGGLGGEMAVAALEQCASDQVHLIAQDHTLATYCSTYKRNDTWIDWTRDATALHNFIRAWDPDMGALTLLDGKRLKIWRSEIAEGSGAPGTILEAGRTGITVGCGSGTLRLLELQPENKRRMAAADFLAGNRLLSGAQFGTRPA